jgi:hypothetical protein
VKSTIGCRTRRSTIQKATVSTAATANRARLCVEASAQFAASAKGEDERRERSGQEHEPREVELVPGRLITRLTDGREHHRHPEGQNGHVDPEDQSPVQVDEHPSDQGPSQRQHRDRGPDAERAWLLVGWEGVTDNRERERQQHRRAESLDDPAEDDRVLAPGRPGQHRAAGEHRQPDGEQTPAADMSPSRPAVTTKAAITSR